MRQLKRLGASVSITESEIWEALKQIGRDKSPGLDGLPYEVYLRQSPVFVPLLALIYNNWMKQGSIPQRFTRGVIKLLRKKKGGGDGIDNYRPLTMLNTELKILAKVLAGRLQAVLASLIGPEQTCAVKGRTIQDNLHLVRLIIEKVDSDAALINLDQSKAFDRVDHRFLEAVLSAAGFGPYFRSWIRLLYASPGALVEVNGVRSKSFLLSRSIRQGCPLSPLLYVLALEPFLRKLKANPVLRGISLPGATTSARYSAYADDVSVLVSSKAEINEVSKEISGYELVTGAKINRDKSSGLRLGSWKGVSLPGPFLWTDGPVKILGIWFGPDLLVEMNWSEAQEKAEDAVKLWSRRNLSLKGKAEVCASHIYPIFLYRLSVLPLPPDVLIILVRFLFSFLWGGKSPKVTREICYLHPSEGGLGMPFIEIRQHMLRISFLDRMCMQPDENGGFWKEDARNTFPSLRNVRSPEEEATGGSPGEGSFYGECRRALGALLRATAGLSDVQALSRKALYQVLVRGRVHDDLIDDLGLSKREARSIWPWTPGLKCLNNTEASLTWLVIRGALWIGKRLCGAGLVKSPNCVRCGEEVETIGHAFFHCKIVVPLCKFVEDLMVRMLRGKFFVLEASSVCSNVAPPLSKTEHYVFLCLLGIMRVVIWTTRQKEVYEGQKFSSSLLICYFKHQLKVKIRTERKLFHSSDFGKRWVTVSRLCRVKGADLEFHFDPG